MKKKYLDHLAFFFKNIFFFIFYKKKNFNCLLNSLLWNILNFLLRDILNTFLRNILQIRFLVVIRYIISLIFDSIIISDFFVFRDGLIIYLFNVISVSFLLRHVLHLTLDLRRTLRYSSYWLLIYKRLSHRLKLLTLKYLLRLLNLLRLVF